MFKGIYRFTTVFLLASLAVFLISACNFRVSNHPPSLSKVSSIANCRVIQHIMGETCVPKNPQRIVTLSADTLGNILALGVKPIGSANEFLKEGEFYPYFSEAETQGITTVGKPEYPNLERLLLLKPDLIIGWGGYTPQAIYPLLSRIAPTVLYNWQNNTWKENFNFIADVLGEKEAAQSAWIDYEKRIQKLQTTLGNRYTNKKVSFVFTHPNGIGSAANNSFLGSIIKDVGLQRPKSQDIVVDWGFMLFSEEELEKVDGDVLFVAKYNDDRFLYQLKQKPLWRTLKAVQQNNVYPVTDSAWYGQNMTAAKVVIDELFKYLVSSTEIGVLRPNRWTFSSSIVFSTSQRL